MFIIFLLLTYHPIQLSIAPGPVFLCFSFPTLPQLSVSFQIKVIKQIIAEIQLRGVNRKLSLLCHAEEMMREWKEENELRGKSNGPGCVQISARCSAAAGRIDCSYIVTSNQTLRCGFQGFVVMRCWHFSPTMHFSYMTGEQWCKNLTSKESSRSFCFPEVLFVTFLCSSAGSVLSIGQWFMGATLWGCACS